MGNIRYKGKSSEVRRRNKKADTRMFSQVDSYFWKERNKVKEYPQENSEMIQ